MTMTMQHHLQNQNSLDFQPQCQNAVACRSSLAHDSP